MHLWHDFIEEIEVKRILLLLDSLRGTRRKHRRCRAKTKNVMGTHFPAFAFTERDVGVNSYFKVLSWISGRLTVTYTTFCGGDLNAIVMSDRRGHKLLFHQIQSFAGPKELQDGEKTWRSFMR